MVFLREKVSVHVCMSMGGWGWGWEEQVSAHACMRAHRRGRQDGVGGHLALKERVKMNQVIKINDRK